MVCVSIHEVQPQSYACAGDIGICVDVALFQCMQISTQAGVVSVNSAAEDCTDLLKKSVLFLLDSKHVSTKKN